CVCHMHLSANKLTAKEAEALDDRKGSSLPILALAVVIYVESMKGTAGTGSISRREIICRLGVV
ncbi:MAG: hypothetical protein V4671_00420, partial [Armatimonadota bacterium]